jgi:hypothetical protein
MKYIFALVLFASPGFAQDATVYIMPQIPTEAEKIDALKLAYELNGNSMVRAPGAGSIDLSGPKDPIWPEPLLSKADKKKGNGK